MDLSSSSLSSIGNNGEWMDVPYSRAHRILPLDPIHLKLVDSLVVQQHGVI